MLLVFRCGVYHGRGSHLWRRLSVAAASSAAVAPSVGALRARAARVVAFAPLGAARKAVFGLMGFPPGSLLLE